MKKVLILTLAMAVVVAFSGSAIYAQQINKGKETLVLDASLGKITFEHKKHQERVKEDCKVCHHKTEAGTQPEPCSKCHTKAAQDKTPSIKDAAHKTCQECHEKEKAAGKNPPPKTPCTGCHVKAAAK